jgi:hypothetical protein
MTRIVVAGAKLTLMFPQTKHVRALSLSFKLPDYLEAELLSGLLYGTGFGTLVALIWEP